ncbi:RNA polymerase sigma factor [Aggregatilinea lenta]|uniref:RNA polymerase sigma factor n=1 Tax=Aggregatilinea lenta TaxID=913108 RepID=UPI000E5A43F5|nr:sigma-70 family RNA polymerase sigma factor [Aggregatilinea lenta]
MDQPVLHLVERIQAGDEEALLALHARYASLVYSVAYRIMNDAMAAEEVTQDTFMRLWHKAALYDAGKGSFVTWLLTIARRIAIDTFRRQRRDPILNTLWIDDNIEQWENTLSVGQNGELARLMRVLMDDLPGEQRQAIELAYFYGMTHSQISEYVDLPLGTVKTRLRLGMEKLRAAWIADPSTDPASNDHA